MPTKPAPSQKASKKQVHETLSEKLKHALADFGHMVHEIHLEKMVKKAASYLTDALHKKKHTAKKTVGKTAKKVAGKTTATSPAAKKW